MNIKQLKMELVKREMSIPDLALRMGVSKKLIYSRIKGETSFTQREICAIANILDLSRDDILDIFFAEKVS